MNIHNIYGWYEYSLLHGMFEYTWVRYGWHGYSWAHVTDDWIFMSTRDGRLNIHKHTCRMTEYDHTSRVTWIFMSTNYGSHESRHRWHEYSWVGLHVMGDMNIHEYTSRVTWLFMSNVTGDMIIHEYTSRVTWLFMRIRHGWHEYSRVHVTGDMIIHEYT